MNQETLFYHRKRIMLFDEAVERSGELTSIFHWSFFSDYVYLVIGTRNDGYRILEGYDGQAPFRVSPVFDNLQLIKVYLRHEYILDVQWELYMQCV